MPLQRLGLSRKSPSSGHTYQGGSGTILDKTYPVGSLYFSVNSTSPAILLGGEWEQIQDRFLLAAGSTYSAGATGGEASHTLTTNEMPSHTHNGQLYYIGWPEWPTITTPDDYYVWNYNGSWIANPNMKSMTDHILLGNSAKTTSTGGSKAHNNLPPYLVVYVWQRIA